MNHILRGHHPKYWTGENKSMFDPDLSINDIKKIVGTIVEEKSKAIEAGLKSRDKEAVVTYKINEVKYRFVVKKDRDNKSYIATLFPLK